MLKERLFNFFTGIKILNDYGVIGKATDVIGLGYYLELRLLKVQDKKGIEFFVFETKYKNKYFPGYNTQWYRINKEALKNLYIALKEVLD